MFRTIHDARVGIVGTYGGFFAYPLSGVDDSNRVDLPRRPRAARLVHRDRHLPGVARRGQRRPSRPLVTTPGRDPWHPHRLHPSPERRLDAARPRGPDPLTAGRPPASRSPCSAIHGRARSRRLRITSNRHDHRRRPPRRPRAPRHRVGSRAARRAAGGGRSSTRRSRSSREFAEQHAGRVAELDGAGLAAAMHTLERDPRARRQGRLVRLAALLHRHRGPRARRAAGPGPGARDRDRDAAAVLRARVGGRRRRDCRPRCWQSRRARLLPPLPAQRPPLPAAPADRAGGEDPRREGDLQPRGVEPAVRRAGVGDPGRRSRAPRCRSTSRSAACRRPTARSAAGPPRRRPPRSSPGCAPARSSSTRCSRTRPPTTGCGTTRTGWPAATSATRPPTSR